MSIATIKKPKKDNDDRIDSGWSLFELFWRIFWHCCSQKFWLLWEFLKCYSDDTISVINVNFTVVLCSSFHKMFLEAYETVFDFGLGWINFRTSNKMSETLLKVVSKQIGVPAAVHESHTKAWIYSWGKYLLNNHRQPIKFKDSRRWSLNGTFQFRW